MYSITKCVKSECAVEENNLKLVASHNNLLHWDQALREGNYNKTGDYLSYVLSPSAASPFSMRVCERLGW